MVKASYFYWIFTGWFLSALNRAYGAVGGGGQPGDSTEVELVNPIGCDDFGCIADKVINGLLGIAIPIVAIMVLIGGFQILTAGGDPEKFKSGRKTVLYAVIGYGVILVAKGAELLIRSILSP